LKEPDSALIIWGGSDINPAYYDHPMHSTTYPGGQRDRLEWSLMQAAIEKGIAIIGVCRGAQMACAAAGGFLIQDVENHSGRHDVTTFDGKVLQVNSIHHQMMVPQGTEHQLVAWSSKPLSVVNGRPYYGYKADEQFVPPEGWVEPEFIYFPKINAYAIQWHPEMMPRDAEATQYVLSFIKEKEDERRTRDFTLACSC
jgi:putative glutamine amidotransferase